MNMSMQSDPCSWPIDTQQQYLCLVPYTVTVDHCWFITCSATSLQAARQVPRVILLINLRPNEA